jgi:hypothetical protein
MASVNDSIQNSNVTPLSPSKNSETQVQLRRDFQNYLEGFRGTTYIKRHQPAGILFDTVEHLHRKSDFLVPERS